MKKNHCFVGQFVMSGLAVGFPVTVACMGLIGGFTGPVKELLIWMVASALFGLVSGLFFQKLNLNALAATALHCVCCLLIAATACTLCGYGAGFGEILLAVLPVFVVVYAVVYGCIYAAMRREAKKINEVLNQE